MLISCSYAFIFFWIEQQIHIFIIHQQCNLESYLQTSVNMAEINSSAWLLLSRPLILALASACIWIRQTKLDQSRQEGVAKNTVQIKIQFFLHLLWFLFHYRFAKFFDFEDFPRVDCYCDKRVSKREMLWFSVKGNVCFSKECQKEKWYGFLWREMSASLSSLILFSKRNLDNSLQ